MDILAYTSIWEPSEIRLVLALLFFPTLLILYLRLGKEGKIAIFTVVIAVLFFLLVGFLFAAIYVIAVIAINARRKKARKPALTWRGELLVTLGVILIAAVVQCLFFLLVIELETDPEFAFRFEEMLLAILDLGANMIYLLPIALFAYLVTGKSSKPKKEEEKKEDKENKLDLWKKLVVLVIILLAIFVYLIIVTIVKDFSFLERV